MPRAPITAALHCLLPRRALSHALPPPQLTELLPYFLGSKGPAECIAFLSQPILVAVGPPGPKKALQPEKPNRADVNKAARTCIDWAIKEYGDDGKTKGK